MDVALLRLLYDGLIPVFRKPKLISKIRIQRFDHWSLEFGYCLFFVIWCLEFSQIKELTLLRYARQNFILIVGHEVIESGSKIPASGDLRELQKIPWAAHARR